MNPFREKPHVNRYKGQKSFTFFRLESKLLNAADKVLGKRIPRSIDQVRALMVYALGLADRKNGSEMKEVGEQITVHRVREMLKSFQFQADMQVFENAKAYWGSMLNDSPKGRAEFEEHKKSYTPVKYLLGCIDQRAAYLLTFSTLHWVGPSRGYLGTNLSQALFSDGPEMLALMFWRYGRTDDVNRALACTVANGVQTAIETLKPTPEVLALLRPTRSHFTVKSMESVPDKADVATWIHAYKHVHPGVDVENLEDGTVGVAVDDATRDEFLQGLRDAYPLHTIWIGVNFKALAIEQPAKLA